MKVLGKSWVLLKFWYETNGTGVGGQRKIGRDVSEEG